MNYAEWRNAKIKDGAEKCSTCDGRGSTKCRDCGQSVECGDCEGGGYYGVNIAAYCAFLENERIKYKAMTKKGI